MDSSDAPEYLRRAEYVKRFEAVEYQYRYIPHIFLSDGHAVVVASVNWDVSSSSLAGFGQRCDGFEHGQHPPHVLGVVDIENVVFLRARIGCRACCIFHKTVELRDDFDEGLIVAEQQYRFVVDVDHEIAEHLSLPESPGAAGLIHDVGDVILGTGHLTKCSARRQGMALSPTI